MQKHPLLLLVICVFSVVLNGQPTFALQPFQPLPSQTPDKQVLNTAAPPVAEIGIPVGTACPGSFVQFADESQNTPTSWSWSFPGGIPSSSSLQHPVVFYPDPGTYNVSLTVANAEGSSSATSNAINVQTGHVKYLFYDAMEGGLDDWMVENPDNSTTWAIINIGGAVYGRQAAFMDNYNYDAEGEKDALITPLLDFSEETGMRLLIDYAYQRHSLAFNDELRIYVSTDGGNTYPDEVFFGQESGGGNFSTTPDGTDQFFPAVAADWCHSGSFGADCMDIDLSAYAGESQVRIKIENTNGFGNNLFIDHVRITADCSVPEPPAAFFTTSTASGCAPLTVQFMDSSQGTVDSWQWSFPGGTPSSSNLENPLVSYTVPGSYPVTLTVSNDAGSSTTSLNGNIEVTGPPEPLFEYSIQGLTVAFNNLSGNYTSVEWKFGDGAESEEVSPVHTYAAPGVYTVELVAANECGKEEFTEEVTIVPPPTAAFQSESLSGCAPVLMQFINISSFGETSTAPDPICSFAAPGTYEVTLITYNATGADTLTQMVTVSGAPQSGFFPDYTPGSFTVSFQNMSLGAFFFEWDFGDDSPVNTDFFPTHTYDTTGFYSVTLIATNECGSDTTIREVAILLPPVADFSLPQDTVCAPFSVEPVNTSEGIVENWLWIVNGANPDTLNVPVPSFTFDTPGTYDIVLQASNEAGSSQDTATIVVGITPTSAFSLIDTLGASEISTVNTSLYADNYFWSFGDGSTSDETAPIHTYAEDGDYLVTLITGNACGADTLEQIVSVVTPPLAGIANADTSGCAVFVVTPEFAGTSNYDTISWSAPGSVELTADTIAPAFTYETAGVYDLMVMVNNAAGSSTDTLRVTVGASPDASFEAAVALGSLNLGLNNESEDADSYIWDFGDGNSSSDFEPSHTFAGDGVYTVQLIVSNECGSDTTSREVEVVTAPTAGFTTESTAGCAPFTLTLTNTASANTTAFNYTATGAVPPVSSDPNPTFTFPSAGQFTIIQAVSNAAGSSSDTLTIAVGEVPDAGFEGVSMPDTALLELTNTSTGATAFAWDFGDGNTSTEVSPSHTYTDEGTYTVTLIATNTCGADTLTQSFPVVTLPVASIELEMVNGCLPFTVNPVGMASANTATLLWTAPGAAPETSTEAAPAFTYTEAGIYTIYFEASNAAGISMDSTTIEVQGPPEPAFSAEVEGFTVSLTNTSALAQHFNWSFGDGNSSEASAPAHTYASPGDYDITLTAVNECGQADTTVSISIVLPPPTAGFEVEGTSGCAPFEVAFTNTSQFGSGFEWNFPGGTPATDTTANPVVVYETPGVFSAALIVNNASGSDTIELPDLITVGAGPQAGFDFSTDQATVSFTNTAVNADAFLWWFGNGSTSTDVNPVHDYGMAGVFEVTLIAENVCGTDTLQQTIEIEGQVPEAMISFGNTAGACVPLTLELLASSSEGAPADSWQWLLPGGDPETATGETVAVTYDEAGTYSITLIGVNAFGADTLTLTDTIQLDEVPVAGFDYETQEGDVAFTNTSTGTNLFFLWDFGDGNTSTDADPNHSYAETGQYDVTLTVGNSCDTLTVSQVLNIMVSSTGDWADLEAFEVFPNPNRGLFTVEITAMPAEELEFRLFNLIGQQLQSYESDFKSGHWQQNINATNLPSGIYLLELRIGQKRAFRRVFVE